MFNYILHPVCCLTLPIHVQYNSKVDCPRYVSGFVFDSFYPPNLFQGWGEEVTILMHDDPASFHNHPLVKQPKDLTDRSE